jgi:hypothetical protein
MMTTTKTADVDADAIVDAALASPPDGMVSAYGPRADLYHALMACDATVVETRRVNEGAKATYERRTWQRPNGARFVEMTAVAWIQHPPINRHFFLFATAD